MFACARRFKERHDLHAASKLSQHKVEGRPAVFPGGAETRFGRCRLPIRCGEHQEFMANYSSWGAISRERSVSRLMPRRRQPPSQTWRTFLANHLNEIASVDLFTVPTVAFRVLFFLVAL